MSAADEVTSNQQPTIQGWKIRLVRAAAITFVLLLILVAGLLALLSALVGTSTGSAWLLKQSIAPLQNESRQISFEQSQGTLLAGMRVENLRYQEGDRLLHIASLRSSWNPMSLLSGVFVLDRLTLDGVSVNWPSTQESNAAQEVSTDPFADILPLPLNLSVVKLELLNANFVVDDLAYKIDSLSLAATLMERHLSLSNLEFAAPPLQILGSLEADLEQAIPLQVNLNWQYNGTIIESVEQASGVLQVSGDLNTLQLNHELQSPAVINSTGSLEANLFADTTREQQFQLTHRIAPQVLNLPKLSSDQYLRIDSAQIVTEGSLEEARFSGEASVTLENSGSEMIVPPLDLRWASLWQGQGLVVDTLEVNSPTGQIAANGSVNWQDSLSLDVNLRVQQSSGEQYQPMLPEGLVIGALNGSAHLSVQESDSGYAGELLIREVEGELNNYPLSAQGTLIYGPQGLQINDLRAASGNTTISVNGSWADTLNLNWEIDATDIGTLSPLLAGSIDATGNLRGTPETPQITLDASGDNLDFAGTRIASFRAKGMYLNNSNTLQLDATGIQLTGENPQRIDSLSIAGQGTPAQHTLSAALRAAQGEIDLEVTGELQLEAPLQWSGRLLNGRILSDLGQWQVEGQPSLSASATTFALSSQCWHQAESTLCLEADWASSGEITANAQLRDYPLSHFNAPVSSEQSPLPSSGALLPQLPLGSRAEGLLSADFNVTGMLTEDPSALRIQFNVNAGEGQIQVEPALPDADELAALDSEPLETQTFYWRDAQVNGTRIDNEWQISSQLDFYQPNLANTGMSVQGNADAQLSVLADQQLDGQVNLAFNDLSWVEAFVPSLQNTQGQLQGLTLISGTFDAPRLGGNITLSDASVDVPGLGLQLRDITATMTSDINQTVAIQGRASSGDGSVQFFSEIDAPMSAERSFEIRIDGENFTLANDAEILLSISPSIEVTGDATSVNISGAIELPVVDVQLTELPEAAFDVSTDTVIVASDPQTPQVHNAALADRGFLDDMDVTAQVSIKLGDEARFRGFGLDMQLAGALDITQRETGAPLSYGELTIVEGNYETYGRQLNIEHGKLLFFGSLDNPALDIRAVRQTEDVRAGVQMNGTLRNIRSQLFSTPTLPDSDILAVLITGRPFAEMGNQDSNALAGAITSLGINQGQSFTNQVRTQLGLDTLAINSTGETNNSSLTLGKYLTPKIFIRYGVGLFETESTLSVDYSISDRIKLEAKSGSTQSVDIKYTVER